MDSWKATTGRSSDKEKVRREKIKDGEDQRGRKVRREKMQVCIKVVKSRKIARHCGGEAHV